MKRLVGLTGSIGMGKSTTAKLFESFGCKIWDADSTVHKLYEKGGRAVVPIRNAFPKSEKSGAIDRTVLKEILQADPTAFEVLNKIVHPLVAQDRKDFAKNAEKGILVFDIPLLFENKMQDDFDATVCVVTSLENQFARVMAREGMTQNQFELIKSRQMPTDDKAALADFVVRTDTMQLAKDDVEDIVKQLSEGL